MLVLLPQAETRLRDLRTWSSRPSTPRRARRLFGRIYAGARKDALEEMLILCAADLLPLRPGRSEPRVLKRRPKPYQSLTRPRHLMRVSPSRDNKGKPRKANPIPSLN